MARPTKLFCPEAGVEVSDGRLHIDGQWLDCVKWATGKCTLCDSKNVDKGRPMTEVLPTDNMVDGGEP